MLAGLGLLNKGDATPTVGANRLKARPRSSGPSRQGVDPPHRPDTANRGGEGVNINWSWSYMAGKSWSVAELGVGRVGLLATWGPTPGVGEPASAPWNFFLDIKPDTSNSSGFACPW